jgi:hypothetical protein
MGYTTSFSLTVDPVEMGDKIEEFVEDAASGEDTYTTWWHNYALVYDGPGSGSWSSLDMVKWYSYAEDVLEVSTHFPGALFELSGDGEESMDMWKFWARDGKGYQADVELVFPVFDEAYLK